MKIVKDKFENLWKYPYGTIVTINNNNYVYIDRDYELGYVFYKDGNIHYDDEFYEEYGIEDDTIIDIILYDIEIMLNMLINGLVAYILILSEDFINEKTINYQLKRLNLYVDIFNTITKEN